MICDDSSLLFQMNPRSLNTLASSYMLNNREPVGRELAEAFRLVVSRGILHGGLC